jgi:hypothetical protein
MLGRKCNGLFQSKQTSERVKPQSLCSLSWLRFKLATLKIQVTSITVWPNLLIIRGEQYMLLRDDIIQTRLYNKGFLIYIICENIVFWNLITLRVETTWKNEHYKKNVESETCMCDLDWSSGAKFGNLIMEQQERFFFRYITTNCLKKTLCCVCVMCVFK